MCLPLGILLVIPLVNMTITDAKMLPECTTSLSSQLQVFHAALSSRSAFTETSQHTTRPECQMFGCAANTCL